jgi:hypothetical protein
MAGQSLSNEQLWAVYAAGIAQAAGFATVPAGFVLCGTSLIANLAVASKALPVGAVPNMQEALFQVYNLADTALPLQGIYAPTQHSFFSDYAAYIDNLVPAGSQKAPTETQAGQLRLFQSALTDANNKYNTDLNAASAAWNQTGNAGQGQYPTFESFLNGTNWGAMLNADNTNAVKISTQIQALLITIYGVDYLAIQTDKTVVDNVRSAMQGSVGTAPYNMLVQATSGNLVVPAYSPSDLTVFSAWVDAIIMQHNNIVKTGTPPVKISFDQATAKNSNLNSPYLKQTNWAINNFFFTAANGNAALSSQVNINTGDPGFSLQFQFDDVTQVSLTRGPWYNDVLTTTPYAYPNPGNLSVPISLIIGMYPQIKMTLDVVSYASAFSAYNTAGGFGFGSFWVSASHTQGAAKQPMTAIWNNTANAVTIQSLSVNPIILAMEVDLLPG